MLSKIKNQINTLSAIHVFFVFLFAIITLLPFIFLNVISINISFFLFFISLLVFVFLKIKCLSFVIEEKKTHFFMIIFMCLFSALIAALIYVLFYSLGYNHIFFKTPICLISFVICLAISFCVDLFWFFKWKRYLRK